MPLLSPPALPQNHSQTPSARHTSFGLLPRLLALTLLFAAELVLLSTWLDNSTLVAQGGILALVGESGAWAVRGAVGFAALLVTFAWLTRRSALVSISTNAVQTPIRLGFLAAHFATMTLFGALCWTLYGGNLGAFPPGLAIALWLLTGLAGIVFALIALIAPNIWSQLLHETRAISVFAFALVVAACIAGNYIRMLWGPTTNLTFFLSRTLLSLFVSGIVSDPATKLLGTQKFQVIIAPECSGFEGVGLILAFSVFWLWLFRRECRFPQALLLVPAGVVTIFLLNAVRITTLILIGNAGAPQVAAGGFHSQAGWIAFNAVALGFSFAATRVPWLTRRAPHTAPSISAGTSDNPSTPYLLPFLSILAVGMLTTAASSNFEWLYPLRFVAAAAGLWTMRKRYSSLDWKFTWFGPSIGILVFALWIACDALQKSAAAGLPQPLANAAAPLRIGWIAFRILAAVITVPIAEELAFRGFLLRRIASANFESLPTNTFTWLGLLLSSVAFGLLHGHLWFAGAIAGLLYAWAMLRRGRIGEAIAAHATTNALLACYVLTFHKWHLW
jgi:exosortase E/protease (VPEID-CTERM system)